MALLSASRKTGAAVPAMGAAARAAKLHTRAEGRYLVHKQKVADLRVQTQCVAGRAPRRPIAQATGHAWFS